MNVEDLARRLAEYNLAVELKPTTPDPHLEVPREILPQAARLLRDDPDLAFDSLMCLSGLDRPDSLEVVYNLFSFKHLHKVTLKTRCPKDDPAIPTVSPLWPTADWHEREAYDLIGIQFTGHPDLRRILLPDDWEGHPLRKDYQAPALWHDIPVTNPSPTNE
ncbi:MAG: NADH-quinone oxidoreductase subunit C [Candidatus Zixiibacteriota bacterium]|nr:MAG: NADH-quinone oxidoreductase subunit C [candidate division Zixibacteria bacterium]